MGQVAQAASEVADELFGAPKRLADMVRATSHTYTRQRDGIAKADDLSTLQARLRFFLPRDVPKVTWPLAELKRADALPKSGPWRVLDLGAGFGTTSLGVALATGAVLEVQACDRIARALDGFAQLAERLPVQVTLDARVEDVQRAADHGGQVDLILLGLVINELEDEALERLFESLSRRLAEGGSVIVLEPALRMLTQRLHAWRGRLMERGWTIFAPCLHSQECPMSERDWCHEERSFELPEPLAKVARAAGLRSGRSTFAYLTLRRDQRRLADVVRFPSALRVVSSRLKSKGKLELIGCGDGRLRRLRRMDREASEANAGFGDARRGDILMEPLRDRVGREEAIARWTLSED